METLVKKPQTGQFWTDEGKIAIPSNRLKKSEKMREKYASQLANDALRINKLLADFKAKSKKLSNEIQTQVRLEANLTDEDKGKGNFVWFNFDRSVKVERSINERIVFDDLEIGLCQEKLNKFLDENLESNNETALIRDIVKDAFSNTKGRLDAKKVMTLLKYKSKVKSPLYLEAMEHLENSIRKPESKEYFQVSLVNDEGAYKVIELNFSSINIQ